MLLTRTAILALGVIVLSLTAVHGGQGGTTPKQPPADQKSRAAVEGWVRRIMTKGVATSSNSPIMPKVDAVGADAVGRILPDEHYYAVHFPTYPRAVLTPAPLQANNVVCVRPDGSVDRVESLDALIKHFAEKLPPIRDEAQARAAVLAFIPLAAEFQHRGRGRYSFGVPEDAVAVSREGDLLSATGKAVVNTGGDGQLTVTLPFDASGKLRIHAVKVDSRVRAQPPG